MEGLWPNHLPVYSLILFKCFLPPLGEIYMPDKSKGIKKRQKPQCHFQNVRQYLWNLSGGATCTSLNADALFSGGRLLFPAIAPISRMHKQKRPPEARLNARIYTLYCSVHPTFIMPFVITLTAVNTGESFYVRDRCRRFARLINHGRSPFMKQSHFIHKG